MPVCKTTVINQENVKRILDFLPSPPKVEGLSETFKTLSDPTRLRIVLALSKQELCVCDIAAVLNMSVSAISHQLRLLKNSRIVKFRKQGKMVFYELDDQHINRLIQDSLEHLNE